MPRDIANAIIREPTGIVVRLDSHTIRLQWFGANILRVKAWLSGDEPQDTSFAVTAAADESHNWEVREERDGVVLSGEAMHARVRRADGRIAFTDADGNAVLSEQSGGRRFGSNDYPRPEDRLNVEQWFDLDDSVALFGLGQYPDGVMNWRGHDVRLIQGNTIVVNPFLLSNRGWGILWDNPSHTEFHDGSDGMRLWSDVADALDYYVCVGANADDAIAGYRLLTGRAPMFGMWAYGYWQCKERYKTAEELVSVVREYRDRGVPLDNIVQDWCYWGDWDKKENWSGMFVDEEQYGDFYGAIRTIHDMNAKVMVSIWPTVGKATELARELEEHGHLFRGICWSGARCYDAFSKEARDIYWRYAKRGLFDHGIDAWWMDATEPEFRDTHDPLTNKAGALEDTDTAAGSWARVLNAFSLVTTQGVYEGQREATDEKRVFILTRSAFAGQQRFGAATWSGDIAASWPVFAGQVPAGLNFCMAGIPYWTTDNGGFFVRGNGAQFPRGVEDPAFRELFVRWFQYSTFCPLMRSHGTQTPREVWQFGGPGDVFYDTLVAFDHLRYRLLPYVYSLAAMVTLRGYTIMRGLAMDFPGDAKASGIGDQFMFGPALMPCPVTSPMYHLPGDALDIVQQGDIADEEGVSGALTARFHSGTELDDEASSKRAHTLDFSWSGSGPDGVQSPDFSARFTGSLRAPQGGARALVIRADNGLRVRVGGETRIDELGRGPVREHRIPLALQSGRKADICIEYAHHAGDSVLQVGWERCSAPTAVDPDDIEKARDVYLPEGRWCDFWTGETLAGGEDVVRPSPVETIPILVRGGSLVPMGPKKQWSAEKPADPIELRIYPGADASFTLYEDAGDGYGYEQGEYATIELSWGDDARTLAIGERQGSFPGMLEKRTFHCVLVRENHGVGLEPDPDADALIVYDGGQTTVSI